MANQWILGGVAGFLAFGVGCASAPCEPGELSAEWKEAPLDKLVPSKKFTVCKASDTHGQFWVKGTVHDANMAGVSSAQDNGWNRVSDNWYGTGRVWASTKRGLLVIDDGKIQYLPTDTVPEINGTVADIEFLGDGAVPVGFVAL